MGHGKMELENGSTLASRGFGVYSLHSDLDLRMSGFIFGSGLEYSLWRQAEDPAKRGNSNTQGKELSWARMLPYNCGPVIFRGRYYLGSIYDLDRPNAVGQAVSY